MSDGMTHAMQRYGALELDHGQLAPKGAGDIMLLADYLVRHGMSQGHTFESAVGAITKALELGKPPTWGLQNVAVIHGRATIWGPGLKGLACESPSCKAMCEGTLSGPEIVPFLEDEWEGDDPESRMMRAVQRRIRVRWAGLTEATRRQADYILAYIASIRGDVVRVNIYDIDEARRAGLAGKGGGMYEKHPRRMVLARATGYHVRDVYPEHMVGGMTAEEAIDGDFIDTTASEKPAAPPKVRSAADLVETPPAKPPAPAPAPVDAEVVEPKPADPPPAEPEPAPAADIEIGKRLAAIQTALADRGLTRPKIRAHLAQASGGKAWVDMTDHERMVLVEAQERELGLVR